MREKLHTILPPLLQFSPCALRWIRVVLKFDIQSSGVVFSLCFRGGVISSRDVEADLGGDQGNIGFCKDGHPNEDRKYPEADSNATVFMLKECFFVLQW